MNRSNRLRATAVVGLLACSTAAWAHGGAYAGPPMYKPPRRERGPAGPERPGDATTPGGSPFGPGPTTGAEPQDPLGTDDWTSWWLSNRRVLAPTSAPRMETPATGDAAPGSWRARVTATLLAGADDPSEDVATAALLALGKDGDAAWTAALTKALADRSRTQPVREAAACGLALLAGGAKGAEARRALEFTALSREAPPRLRAICVHALGLRRESESEELLTGFTQVAATDPQVAAAAATALGTIGTPSALETLCALLEKGLPGAADPVLLRVYAAHGLARAGSPSSVAPLRRALADPEPAVRRAACLAIDALAARDDDATLAALRRIVDTDKDVSCRDVAIVAIGRQGHPKAKALLDDAVRGGRQVHATYAACALGLWARRQGDPSAAEPLHAGLGPRADAGVRGVVCVAEALARDRASAPTIVRIAEGSGDPKQRALAVAALGVLGDREVAAGALRRLLDASQPPDVRREAAIAVGLIGDAGAVEGLRGPFETSESLYVRAAAAVAIGRVGGPEAAELLLRHAQSSSDPPILRAMSVVGLGIVLDHERDQALHLVGADLDWNLATEAVAELMSIL